MKRIFGAMFLLPALGLCLGSHLMPGTEFVYRVWRGAENDSTRTSIRLVDSARTSSGLEWRVAIRDSLIGGSRIRTDTAILRVSDTSLVWTSPSCLAAFDPEPRPPSYTLSMAIRDSIDPWPNIWGSIGNGCKERLPIHGTDFPPVLNGTFLLPSMSNLRGYEASTTRPVLLRSFGLDTILWRWVGKDSLWYSSPTRKAGELVRNCRRFDDATWGMLRLEDPATGEGWRMESRDGAVVPREKQPVGQLSIDPKPGFEMAWRYEFSFSMGRDGRKMDTGEVRWKVLERLSDSSNWVRLKMAQSFCSNRKKCVDTTGRVSLFLEGLGVMVEPPLLEAPAKGLMLDWSSPTNAWSTGETWWAPGFLSCKDEYFRAVPGIGLDSSYLWSQGLLGASSTRIGRKRDISGAKDRSASHRSMSIWNVQDLHAALRAGASLSVVEPDGRRTDLDEASLGYLERSRHGVVLCDLRQQGVLRRGKLLLLR